MVVAVPLCGSLLPATSGGREQRPLPGRFWAAAAALGSGVAFVAAGTPLAAQRYGDTVAVASRTVTGIGLATAAFTALFSLTAVLALPAAVRRRAVLLLATLAVVLASTQLGTAAM